MTYADLLEYLDDASSAVTERVRGLALSALAAAWLLAGEDGDTLAEVELDGLLAWSALAAIVALTSDLLQFTSKTCAWGLRNLATRYGQGDNVGPNEPTPLNAQIDGIRDGWKRTIAAFFWLKLVSVSMSLALIGYSIVDNFDLSKPF